MNLEKRSERFKFQINQVCFDNRIHILKYLPFDHLMQNGGGLCFEYIAENNNMKFQALMQPSGRVDGRLSLVDSRRIFKLLYGYFVTDPTRRIYFLNYRVGVNFFFTSDPSTKVVIKIRDFIPYRCPVISISVAHRRIIMDLSSKVEFDISDMNYISKLDVRGSLSTKKWLERIVEVKKRYESVFLLSKYREIEEEESQNLSLRNFNLLLQKSRYVRLGISSLRDDIVNQSTNFYSHPQCRKLVLKINKNNFFPKNFFLSFQNLNSLSCYRISFSNNFERDDFFRNIRIFAPRLTKLHFHAINIIEKSVFVTEKCNVVDILCRNNSFIRYLSLDCQPFIFENIDLIQDFKNTSLHVINLLKHRENEIEETNLPEILPKEFFFRLYECFEELFCIYIRVYVVGPQSFLDDLPEILQNIPSRVRKLKLFFPRRTCSREIRDALDSKKDQIEWLGISFFNLDFLVSTIFRFPNLVKLSVDSFKFANDFILRKEHLVLFRDNMKNLKSLKLCCREDCDPLIYFLKYSKHTQHLQFATTDLKPLNFPENAWGENTHISDILFHDEFDRESEYFEKESLQFDNFKMRNLVRRRSSKQNDHSFLTNYLDLFRYREGKSRSQYYHKKFEEVIRKIPFLESNEHLKKVILEDVIIYDAEKFNLHFINPGFNQYQPITTAYTIQSTMKTLEEDELFAIESAIDMDKMKFRITLTIVRPNKLQRILLFSRKKLEGNGAIFYNFVSPSTLDYLRFCFSQECCVEKKNNWISRKNFIRFLCSMVGIDCVKMECEVKTKDGFIFEKRDMGWIFRESERIYKVKFEELEDEDIDFVDCIFD